MPNPALHTTAERRAVWLLVFRVHVGWFSPLRVSLVLYGFRDDTQFAFRACFVVCPIPAFGSRSHAPVPTAYGTDSRFRGLIGRSVGSPYNNPVGANCRPAFQLSLLAYSSL